VNEGVAVNNRIPPFRGTWCPIPKGSIVLGHAVTYCQKEIINQSSAKISELMGLCYLWRYLLFNVKIIRYARIKYVRVNYTFFMSVQVASMDHRTLKC